MKERRDRIRARFGAVGADALLVTKPVNVRYLSGYSGSNGQLIVGSEDVFMTDGRYEEQSRHEVPDIRREIYGVSSRTIRTVRSRKFVPAQSLVAGKCENTRTNGALA